MSKSEFLRLLNHQVFCFAPRSGWFSSVDLKGISFLYFFPTMLNCELEFDYQGFATKTLPCKFNKLLLLLLLPKTILFFPRL